ncbi:MAG: SH3 domain protein [Marinobacter sp. HL-58]|nr:MAG: SH3 domain protein [Marinobacter sp. HL-58]
MNAVLYGPVSVTKLRLKSLHQGTKPVTPLRLIFCFLALMVAAASAHAKTVYVDDSLYAPIRSGEGTQYRILHSGVRSGTALELLETSDSGYSRVRTPEGIEGWINSRYVTETPVARQRLEQANKQLEQTRNELGELREQLEEVTSERDELRNSEEALQSRAGKLSEELSNIKEVASDSINLDRRNSELSEENQKLRNELEVLTAEKERLEGKKESDFMLLGAALVLLGVILALVVPLLKPARKTDNWA